MIHEDKKNDPEQKNNKNYIVKLRIQRVKRFFDLIESTKDILNDVNWYFDKQDGIDCQGMDGSQISMLHFHLNKEYFSKFEWKEDTNLHQFKIGISMNRLSQMLKGIEKSNDTNLILKIDEKMDTLELKFSNACKNRDGVSTCKLKLLTIDIDRFDLPTTQQEYDANIRLSSAHFFVRICRDFAIIGDELTLKVNEQEVAFSVQGEGDMDSKKWEFKKNRKRKRNDATQDQNNDVMNRNDETIQIRMEKHDISIEKTVSLKHILQLSKTHLINPFVNIQLSDEFPLLIKYAMTNNIDHIDQNGLENNHNIINLDHQNNNNSVTHFVGVLEYYLAPKHKEQ